jgi:chromosome segregation ATPase
MDENLEFEFNDKVMKALMKKVQDSNTKCAMLDKDLGVKKAEIQYLAKLYDEETKGLSEQLESEKKKAKKHEEQLNEIKSSLKEKEKTISELTSKVNNFSNEHSLMEQEIEKLINELEIANNKIDDQKNIISQ